MNKRILLLDNGSRQPLATLKLRQLADTLSQHNGLKVDAVSLQHANKVDVKQLNGKGAVILHDYLLQHLQAGEMEFVVIPLFFGRSGAVTSFIPQLLESLKQRFPAMKVLIADVLYPLPRGDKRLAHLLFDNIVKSTANDLTHKEHIVLVDHGSPTPEVTQVREQLAAELQTLLPENVILDQAVMEKRKGSQYEFNGPLLQDLLRQKASAGIQHIIVSMLFFLPGRHAGDGGDIGQICQSVQQQYPKLKLTITPLVGDHPLLIEILNDRLQAVVK